MTNHHLKELKLDEGILREPSPDESRVALWVPGNLDAGFRLWERISNVPGAGIALEQGWFSTPVTTIRARQKIHSLLGKLFQPFRKVTGNRLWLLPNGGSAEQIGERSNDVMLVWPESANAEGADAEFRTLWGEDCKIRRVGKDVFILENAKVVAEPNAAIPAISDKQPRQQAEELLAAARKARDCPKQASALTDLGVLLTRDGDAPQAIQLLERALSIARKFQDRALVSDARANLGSALLAGGQPVRAREILEQELADARQAADHFQEKTALTKLAFVHAKTRDHRQAIVLYEQALALARETGDRRHQSELLWFLAIQNAELDQRDQVVAHGEAAIAVLKEMKHPAVQKYAESLEAYLQEKSSKQLLEPAKGKPTDSITHQPVFVSNASFDLSAMRDAAQPTGAGFLRMAFSAAKAILKHIGSGMKRVPVSTRQKRLETCAICPHHTGVRCRLCGCYTGVKTWLPHESCPIGKWPAEDR